jgi:hypothetical protein
MQNRKAVFTTIALVAGVVTMSASAQAQYLTRPYDRAITAHHLYSHQGYGFYGSYAAMNVLPTTIVTGLIGGYDPYDNLPSVYGCCATTQNEHIGLIGANGGAR